MWKKHISTEVKDEIKRIVEREMTPEEIEARKQRLIAKYKKLYAKYNDDSKVDKQQLRRKMILTASEIGWLIEEKRRCRSNE